MVFTFQYVSIISVSTSEPLIEGPLFTFQYVSIISLVEMNKNHILKNLHSNMFLLFPFKSWRTFFYNYHLHSNMFLLFHSQSLRLYQYSKKFTFQYVSIISVVRCSSLIYAYHLHSNMFLLFLRFVDVKLDHLQNLHSNMFLLFQTGEIFERKLQLHIYIPICFYYFENIDGVPAVRIKFTFQYVSIISWMNRTLV